MEFRRALDGHRLFVPVRDLGDDLWPVVEVLVQEGLGAWALPATDPETLRRAVALYGRRACVGTHGVTTPEELQDAFAAGVAFVTAAMCCHELVDAAAGRPFLPGALTPTEVVSARRAGAAAVQIVPADVMGSDYSRDVSALVGPMEFVATGALERFQAELWLDAGASAVGLASLVGEDAADLDELRRRARSFAQLEGGS